MHPINVTLSGMLMLSREVQFSNAVLEIDTTVIGIVTDFIWLCPSNAPPPIRVTFCPEGDFAGRLIEVCGLKGFTVGGAQVSKKHAGFVINRGSATFEDVISLEAEVIRRVYEQTGVTLHREVEIIE